MELRQLEHFVLVAEMGSFSRASLALGVTQPALSRQIRALETELRHNLFHRHGRGVTLTEPGALMLGHARKALHQIELAREQLQGRNGQLAGHVSIGMPPSIARLLTVPLAREMQQRLPSASMSISEGTTLAMQELVVAGRVDLALVYKFGAMADLDVVVLREEKLFLVSAAGAVRSSGPDGPPIPVRQLAELPLIMPGRPSVIRLLVESRMAALGLAPRIALEVDGAGGILNLVRDGAGSAILPLTSVQASTRPEDFSVREVSEPPLSCDLAIIASAHRALTATQVAMRALVGTLVQALAEGAP
jgi:LysR family nitrogen assimilation transcriptional regulator